MIRREVFELKRARKRFRRRVDFRSNRNVVPAPERNFLRLQQKRSDLRARSKNGIGERKYSPANTPPPGRRRMEQAGHRRRADFWHAPETFRIRRRSRRGLSIPPTPTLPTARGRS